ncbi:DUF1926 domain-containing protein [Candidatus Fermentibacterales bacterium]|nr:DUF1926 domain-containing protein [Candidatus Fermentibacterales bacterium]
MKLSLCIHSHQPVGNFDFVLEKAYSDCYEPFLQLLEGHDRIRTGLHYSGPLLEWLEDAHPDFLDRLSTLCASGRVELLTSGYFEPVLVALDAAEAREQIAAFSNRIEGIGGKRPTGLWLTERVWEPSVPSLLHGTGVEYVVVDDSHVIAAGLEPTEVFRPCLTEDQGHPLRVLGSSMELRYSIPFREVRSVMDQLLEWDREGREMAFYGDDGEKFGVWPGTRELCYDRGWLDELFSALGASRELELRLPGESVREVRAVGPVYMPAMSYAEMGEWSLPCSRGRRLLELREHMGSLGIDPSVQGALASGGFWRNFLTRYPESNELHKLVSRASGPVAASASPSARLHLWRSQCNCAYWHGVFGGIYLPHLREALWKELYLAELDAHRELGDLPDLTEDDLDLDGRTEVRLLSASAAVTVRPEEGLCIGELALLCGAKGPVPLVPVLTRREESYHRDVGSAGHEEGVATIHSGMGSKEQSLEELIAFDDHRRFFLEEYLVADGGFDPSALRRAGRGLFPVFRTLPGNWSRTGGGDGGDPAFSASLDCPEGLTLAKSLGLHTRKDGLALTVDWEFRGPPGARIASELNLCLLTGSEPDRCIALGASDSVPVGLEGSGRCSRATVSDLWRGAVLTIELDREADMAHYPVESVNRSEGGYERVHQGFALVISEVLPKQGVLGMHALLTLTGAP